jgi:photosystem II stability/assembly factor-like uncharacterized protein
MNRGLFFLIVLTSGTNIASAQWKGEAWLEVPAYGVHDTTLFQSITGGGITSMYRYGPDTNWHTVGPGINFAQGIITSFASLGRYFFAGLTYTANGSNGPVYSSTDNGASWSEVINSPIASNGKYLFGQSFSIYAPNPHYLARSIDTGKTWDSLINLNVSYITTNGACIYAVTPNDSHRSTDSGKTWSTMSYPLSPPTALVALDTIIFGGSSTGNTGLAWSQDSGATWTQVSFAHPVTALCTDGRNLWAGTADSGVYISTDTGKNWRNVSDGLKYFLQVTAMAVFDTMMIVATVSPGSQNYWQSWRPISEMVDTAPASVMQLQSVDSLSIYPNPALGEVTIISGSTSIYGVNVLNVLGEDVLVMPTMRQSNITLDLSKIPSGTYFLQIETGNGSVLRKVVIQH